MIKYSPLRDLPKKTLTKNDTIFIFGEVFNLGYVNGLINEAKSAGCKVIYSTVGRRDSEGNLRALNQDELNEKSKNGQTPLINIPLECGFDLTKSKNNISPFDQLKDIKLSEWADTKLDWSEIKDSIRIGEEDFKTRVNDYLTEVKKYINTEGNIYFAHTMAGGVPRSKIVMPLFNKVFKGFDKRYLSSKEFWETEIGKLCKFTFESVTSETFDTLIKATSEFRKELSSEKCNFYYSAYGYHGTELLINNEYKWQSYSPYLQGFAKIKLEEFAQSARKNNINATVYNVPEILTNSSSIFLGIEVAIYPLIGALIKESKDHPLVKSVIDESNSLLKSEFTINDVLKTATKYFNNPIIKEDWSKYEQWPQHNGPEHMKLMRTASQEIISMHKDPNKLMTYRLSRIVFDACGYIMANSITSTNKSSLWINHDLVCKHLVS